MNQNEYANDKKVSVINHLVEYFLTDLNRLKSIRQYVILSQNSGSKCTVLKLEFSNTMYFLLNILYTFLGKGLSSSNKRSLHDSSCKSKILSSGGSCPRNMLLECDVYIIFYMNSSDFLHYRSIWLVNKLVTNAFKEEPKIQQLFLIYESREIVGAICLLQGMKPCTFIIFNF